MTHPPVFTVRRSLEDGNIVFRVTSPEGRQFAAAFTPDTSESLMRDAVAKAFAKDLGTSPDSFQFPA